MKKLLALLLALILICALPAALAEETEPPHAELYDPEALLAAFQQLQADNVLYADCPLVESDIDGSDASMGVLAKYSVANSSTALNYVTGRVTVFSDPMAEVRLAFLEDRAPVLDMPIAGAFPFRREKMKSSSRRWNKQCFFGANNRSIV